MSQRKAVTKAKARAYAQADQAGKTRILDELVEMTGWHRDYARTALRDGLKLKVVRPRPSKAPVYGPRIIWGGGYADADERGHDRPQAC